jgi:hypothetical protein
MEDLAQDAGNEFIKGLLLDQLKLPDDIQTALVNFFGYLELPETRRALSKNKNPSEVFDFSSLYFSLAPSSLSFTRVPVFFRHFHLCSPSLTPFLARPSLSLLSR